MIVPRHRSWLRIVFSASPKALHDVWPRVAVTTVVAVGVTAAHLRWSVFDKSLTPVPFMLVAVALGIFLGFRNNSSYDRFWEGRRLWGGVVNTSRTFTRQVVTLVGESEGGLPSATLHRDLVRRMIGYVHALRLHLRDEAGDDVLAPFFDEEERARLAEARNRPATILCDLGRRVTAAYREGRLHPQHLPLLDASLTAFTDLQGGCERIKSTPIPYSYTKLIHRLCAVYCFALPFGIVQTIGAYTPVVVMFIAYAFFGLDAVGEQVEEPFGTDPEDLPLAAISRAIEIEARHRLGETDLPEPLLPKNEILL